MIGNSRRHFFLAPHGSAESFQARGLERQCREWRGRGCDDKLPVPRVHLHLVFLVLQASKASEGEKAILRGFEAVGGLIIDMCKKLVTIMKQGEFDSGN